MTELSRGSEREMGVAGLERALELGVAVALRRHGEHMFPHASVAEGRERKVPATDSSRLIAAYLERADTDARIRQVDG